MYVKKIILYTSLINIRYCIEFLDILYILYIKHITANIYMFSTIFIYTTKELYYNVNNSITNWSRVSVADRYSVVLLNILSYVIKHIIQWNPRIIWEIILLKYHCPVHLLRFRCTAKITHQLLSNDMFMIRVKPYFWDRSMFTQGYRCQIWVITNIRNLTVVQPLIWIYDLLS
jgi:hypothetical protein